MKKNLTLEEADLLAKNTQGLDYAAFCEWIEYRKAFGKPIKVHTYPWLIKRMVKMGDQQQAAVDESAGNGYQGLWPPKTQKGSGVKRWEPGDPW